HTRSKRDWSSDVCSSDLSRRRSLPCGQFRSGCSSQVAHLAQPGAGESQVIVAVSTEVSDPGGSGVRGQKCRQGQGAGECVLVDEIGRGACREGGGRGRGG